jgi:acetylornithine deacetylase/succinyl-diaminopimelate desuccinylase-like protein
MSTISNYIETNKERFLEELFHLISIPSISSDPKYKESMIQTANAIKDLILSAGADSAEVHQTAGNPVVYGEKMVDDKYPTILLYGHYDVQPAEPLELWVSDPFKPEIRDGKIYARGADDDKGQFFIQLKSFEALAKTNNLKCNVKFLVEGEEEIGSPSLPAFCEKNKEMLKADIILISDTTLLGMDKPSITVGLRGITYYDVEVTGPNRDLHSGMFGGAVANPINKLAELIKNMHDDKNRITIPGFYDDVLFINEEERNELSRAPFNAAEYNNSIGIPTGVGEDGYTTMERIGIRPSLDVCGIWGGFTGEGAKTVLPSKAYAKISMRLVPNQDPAKIDEQFVKYIESVKPDGINSIKVTPLHSGKGYVAPLDSIAYKAASIAMEKSFGIKPVPTRSGGSIPVVSDFEQILGIKSILMGFGLDSDAIHSPNENFPLENFYKGLETVPLFYKYFSEMMV